MARGAALTKGCCHGRGGPGKDEGNGGEHWTRAMGGTRTRARDDANGGIMEMAHA